MIEEADEDFSGLKEYADKYVANITSEVPIGEVSSTSVGNLSADGKSIGSSFTLKLMGEKVIFRQTYRLIELKQKKVVALIHTPAEDAKSTMPGFEFLCKSINGAD